MNKKQSTTPPRIYPEGVYLFDEAQTRMLENNRTRCLQLFDRWHYKMVLFPMVDYAESLVIGHDPLLTKDTCQLIDPMSGKRIGIRADITPQAVKLDAHLAYTNNTPNAIYRCCYADMTLQAKPIHWKQGRQILQIGAELFGVSGLSADIEVAQLMLTVLHELGVGMPTLDIGHIGLYKRLAAVLDIDTTTKNQLFRLLQKKHIAELEKLLATLNLDVQVKQLLAFLPRAMGSDTTPLNKVTELIEALANTSLRQDLMSIVKEVAQFFAAIDSFCKTLEYQVGYHFDLCELRGYQYKTGLLFAIYHHQINQPIALGGRYDNDIYGIERPATGFSANLQVITDIQNNTESA